MNYEYRVLQFLDTITHVPTPRPIDFFDIDVPVIHDDPTIEDTDSGTEIWHVMLTSTIPGERFGSAAQSMEPEEIVKVLAKVKGCMDEINSFIAGGRAAFPDLDGNWTPLIPPIEFVSNLDCHRGHTAQLPFYGGDLDGSVYLDDFVSTMSQFARQPPDTADLLTSILKYLGPAQSSDIRFCHMNLQENSIMVHDGQLSGIIDWQYAGWYTWRLEVLGGISSLRSSTMLHHVEAWEISSELKSTILSLYYIRIGMKRLRVMEREAAAMLLEENHNSDENPEQQPPTSDPETQSVW